MSDTVTVAVPSVEVPGGPTFRVSVPASWSASAAPGVVAGFEVAGHADWSMVISTMRIASTTSLRDVAVRTFARQRTQDPGATIRTQRTGRFGDRLTYLRDVLLPGVDPVSAQLQVLFVVPVSGDASVSDVISTVATCPEADIESFGPQVIDVVASFTSGSD